jgi:hypothetical protein
MRENDARNQYKSGSEGKTVCIIWNRPCDSCDCRKCIAPIREELRHIVHNLEKMNRRETE